MGDDHLAVVADPQLYAPADDLVGCRVTRIGTDSTIGGSECSGSLPPAAAGERTGQELRARYARAEELRVRLTQMERERISIPMVIGGEEVETKETRQAVMPHRKEHVLADVAKGGPQHVQQAIDAAREAHADWSRLPGRSAPPSSSAQPSCCQAPGARLVAATMLNQSKTAHQAEIDAAAELIDFWRYNVEFMLRIYLEQPVSSAGVWNRMEYRPLEGFVFAVSPFNFTAIGGNLSGSRR